jgi:hypothetical protein
MILRPLLLIFGLPLLHIALRATPLGPHFGYVMPGMTMIFLAWLAIAAVSAMIAILAGLHGDWRRVASWGVVPLMIGFGAVHHNYVRAYTNLAGDVLNFAVRLPFYRAQIAESPEGTPKLLVFNRGGMIWASSGVVYDDSDEVRLPVGQQSPAWKVRAKHNELGCGGFYVTPLFGHFYLAEFPC